MGGDHRRGGAGEQPVLRLDDRDAAPAERQRCSNFQSYEAAAENGDVLAACTRLADRAGVGHRAQRQHADQVRARQGQRARPRAGGEDRVVEGDMPAARKVEAPASEVDPFDTGAQHQVDAAVCVEGLRAQHLRLGVGLLHEGFGQRRLVVGKLVLVADQRDATIETSLAQARGRLHARMSRTDNDHAVLHDACIPGRSIRCCPAGRPFRFRHRILARGRTSNDAVSSAPACLGCRCGFGIH